MGRRKPDNRAQFGPSPARGPTRFLIPKPVRTNRTRYAGAIIATLGAAAGRHFGHRVVAEGRLTPRGVWKNRSWSESIPGQGQAKRVGGIAERLARPDTARPARSGLILIGGAGPGSRQRAGCTPGYDRMLATRISGGGCAVRGRSRMGGWGHYVALSLPIFVKPSP